MALGCRIEADAKLSVGRRRDAIEQSSCARRAIQKAPL